MKVALDTQSSLIAIQICTRILIIIWDKEVRIRLRSIARYPKTLISSHPTLQGLGRVSKLNLKGLTKMLGAHLWELGPVIRRSFLNLVWQLLNSGIADLAIQDLGEVSRELITSEKLDRRTVSLEARMCHSESSQSLQLLWFTNLWDNLGLYLRNSRLL